MKMKKKQFLMTLFAIFALFLLVACGGDSASDTEAETETETTTTEETAPEEEMEEEAPEEEAMEEEMEEEEMSDEFNAVLLPKFLGILVFDQAYEGALEAATELGLADGLEFLGPTPENSVEGQLKS